MRPQEILSMIEEAAGTSMFEEKKEKAVKTMSRKEKRLDEIQDPELTIDRALEQYLQLGYSENWINQRLKSIEVRKELTDEWKKLGLKEGQQFATLTNIISESWSGKTIKEYKVLKGLKKE